MKVKLSAHAFGRFWDLHAWAGVVASLVLHLMFVAGALTLFHAQLETWEEPLAQRAAAPETLQETLDRALAASGSTPDDLWLFPPAGGRGEARIAHQDQATWATAWVGSRENRLVPERERLAHFLYRLHFLWHDVTGDWLYHLAGLLAVALLLALVTGVLIHLKDLVRQLHRFRPDRSRRVLWSDMHKVLGVMGLPFQLMMSYTGAFIVLAPLLLRVLTGPVFGGDERRAAAVAWGAFDGGDAPAGGPSIGLPLDELARRAKLARPGLEPEYFHLIQHGREGAVVEILGSGAGSPRPRVGVRLRASDGEVLGSAGDADGAAAEARRWIHGLHFARFGGLPLRFLYFALTLAGCGTLLTGNWVWLARRPESRGNEILARLTAGVGAGTWVATGALFVASRALPFEWERRGAAEELTFLFVLGGCVAWALVAADRRSLWWRQLALAAALLLPVPLLAARCSEAGLFGAGPRLAPVVGVDVGILVTALALGAGAWLLRRAAARAAAAHPAGGARTTQNTPGSASPEAALAHSGGPDA